MGFSVALVRGKSIAARSLVGGAGGKRCPAPIEQSDSAALLVTFIPILFSAPCIRCGCSRTIGVGLKNADKASGRLN